MKEDDICELLKFERKMLRARIATLKNDKFIQVRLKMETGNFFFLHMQELSFALTITFNSICRSRWESAESKLLLY